MILCDTYLEENHRLWPSVNTIRAAVTVKAIQNVSQNLVWFMSRHCVVIFVLRDENIVLKVTNL